MGLFRGLVAPFRGLVFVARHRLWGYLMVPVALNAGLAVLAARFATRIVSTRLAYQGVLLYLAEFVVAVLLFVTAQPILSAPFLDALSEKTERIVRGESPSQGFFKSAGLAVWHGVLKSLLFLLGLGMTLGLTLVSGAGGILGAALTALFLVYDGFDYPLARRISSFSGKWSYLFRNPALTIGYAAGVTALYLVPLAAIVAPPFAAVGATLAYLSQEKLTAKLTEKPAQAPPPP